MMHKSKPNGSPTVHLWPPLLKLLAKRWKGVTVSVTRLFNPPPGFCRLIAGSRIHAFQIPKLIEKKLPEECI